AGAGLGRGELGLGGRAGAGAGWVAVVRCAPVFRLGIGVQRTVAPVRAGPAGAGTARPALADPRLPSVRKIPYPGERAQPRAGTTERSAPSRPAEPRRVRLEVPGLPPGAAVQEARRGLAPGAVQRLPLRLREVELGGA